MYVENKSVLKLDLIIKEREMLILLRAKGLSIIKDQGKLSKGIIADHKLPLQNKQGSKLSLYYLVNNFQFGTLNIVQIRLNDQTKNPIS